MNKDQLKKLEADLWSAADKLRANSDLKSSEYATPVLGLIFLKFADNNYRRFEAEILADYTKLKGTRREMKISDIAIEKCGFYLPDHARYGHLLNLPEEKDIARALKEAMKAIEEYKPELEGVLPKDEYAALTRTDKTIPQQLLRTFADIPANATGDLFGQIYEYFLSEFARSEGQKGGEFFTPRSVVRLMVEIIEPHGGKVFDPACGSGGMFVQSAQFIAEHRKELQGSESGVYVCGQEKTRDTVNLARMNLAVNGLRGEIKQANTYYEDSYQSFGAFDYVLANPPFNVDDVSLSSIEKDSRGATQDNLGLSKLLSFPLFVPEVREQQQIAAILSAYEELIENNQRRIALLEKMAEEIYREWFVRLRFPGHEQVKVIKGEPEGWRAVQFTEICEFQKGKTPDQIFLENPKGLLPYITVAFIEGNGTEYVQMKRNSIVCENGDVLMLMDGARSGLVFRSKKGIVGSTFARVAVEPLYRDVVYEFLRATREHIVSNNTGAAIPHANKEFIHRLMMFLPQNEKLIEQFNAVIRGLIEQVQNLLSQNELLRLTRDALLPRLISGKLSVENLDIQFPPGMAEAANAA